MQCGGIWHPYYEWWDSNGDGLFTVSDIGPSLGRILTAPGVFLIRSIAEGHSQLAQFLEIDCSTTSGFLVVLLSLVAWGFAVSAIPPTILLLDKIFSAVRDFIIAVAAGVRNPRKAAIYLYEHPPMIVKVALAPYFLARHYIAVVRSATTVSQKVIEACVGLILYVFFATLWLLVVFLFSEPMYHS